MTFLPGLLGMKLTVWVALPPQHPSSQRHVMCHGDWLLSSVHQYQQEALAHGKPFTKRLPLKAFHSRSALTALHGSSGVGLGKRRLKKSTGILASLNYIRLNDSALID